MANHCIEVGCSNCGAWYCLRGCGDVIAPNEENKLIIIEKIKHDNALKYAVILCRYCQTENLYKL